MKHCSGIAFRTAAVIVLAVSLVSVIGASSPDDEECREAAREIRPETLRAHMGFLAHDLLEGRRTGTRGHEIAALYVASIFDASGLEPGAPDGTYFQRVPLRRPEVVAAELDVVWDTRRQRLRPEEDYAPVGHPIREESRLQAPAVFVGHGVVARSSVSTTMPASMSPGRSSSLSPELRRGSSPIRGPTTRPRS